MNYLSVGADGKTPKGEKFGYLTGILYMAPATLGGGATLCPFSTEGCRRICLNTAGRGAFGMVQAARIRKAREWQTDPDEFIRLLYEDVFELQRKARREGLTPAVRLNGTTDIPWEKFGIMEDFSDVIYYDYTKYPPTLRRELPPNYSVTYSFSEQPASPLWSDGWYARGVNTAAVFMGGLPVEFRGRPVVDGDESDLRFLDPPGVVVGLKVKGKARHDGGDGFVQIYDTKNRER